MATVAATPVTNPLSAYGPARSTVSGKPLSTEELRKTHAYWRACNYLMLGMIYLQDNPLLREPLKAEHVKNRLLGHWGASPGLAFTYIHLNRLIKKQDLNMIFLAGPGHGAPGVLAPVYLEGSYSEVYPEKTSRACSSSSSNSHSLAASAVTAHPRHQARSTKEESLVTFSHTLAGLRLIIQI